MAGDGSNVPDRDRWPEGRLARIESGDLEGMYMLVSPETAGRWVIYVSEDPQTITHKRPYQEDWGLLDDEALEGALASEEFSWVEGEDDALIEDRIFGVRASLRRRQERRAWLRNLLGRSIRRRPRQLTKDQQLAKDQQLTKDELEELDRLWGELSRLPRHDGPPETNDQVTAACLDALLASVISSAGRITSGGVAEFEDVLSPGGESPALQSILDRIAAVLGLGGPSAPGCRRRGRSRCGCRRIVPGPRR